MLDITVTAQLIKMARKKIGMTQQELANKVFRTKQAVSNWERGKNYPDEIAREDLEKVLNIKLHKEDMNSTIDLKPLSVPQLKSLTEIDKLNDLISQVDLIVKSVTVDMFEHTVRKMLTLTLLEILGHEIYYQQHIQKYYLEEPLDWDMIASDLECLINDDDDWILYEGHHYHSKKGLIGDKIYCMANQIGGELFEDFDETGFRKGFEQQIGRYGEACGYDLLKLLPRMDSDIMVIYKTVILDSIDICRSQLIEDSNS